MSSTTRRRITLGALAGWPMVLLLWLWVDGPRAARLSGADRLEPVGNTVFAIGALMAAVATPWVVLGLAGLLAQGRQRTLDVCAACGLSGLDPVCRCGAPKATWTQAARGTGWELLLMLGMSVATLGLSLLALALWAFLSLALLLVSLLWGCWPAWHLLAEMIAQRNRWFSEQHIQGAGIVLQAHAEASVRKGQVVHASGRGTEERFSVLGLGARTGVAERDDVLRLFVLLAALGRARLKFVRACAWQMRDRKAEQQRTQEVWISLQEVLGAPMPPYLQPHWEQLVRALDPQREFEFASIAKMGDETLKLIADAHASIEGGMRYDHERLNVVVAGIQAFRRDAGWRFGAVADPHDDPRTASEEYSQEIPLN